MARTKNMEGVSHNTQTKFAVSNGRGWKHESIISRIQPRFRLPTCEEIDEKWRKHFAELERTRPERAAKFIQGGIKAGVYIVDGDSIKIADGCLNRAFFCCSVGEVAHCGDLFYEAMKYYDRFRYVFTKKADRTPAEPQDLVDAQKALETWLTDNYRRFVLKTVK